MDIPRAFIQDIEALMAYLTEHKLYLTTAESCTAGRITAALGVVPGSGQVIESGHVVYSPQAKIRLLGVNARTIDTFTLTSEEVAREMATGALRNSTANVAVATTGIAGDQPMDGIPPGTVCFAWAFDIQGNLHLFSRTQRFFGDREAIIHYASCFALGQIQHFHRRALHGESA
ncbi:CinA family protein [Pseudomonas typographi]|uniref:CinA family protein n=1 Tax=Pseudomonas typographi TaxID=2715964 RepID=A0ABR7Z5G7_9PSED|nr:CinA family protein [Pseudomonas typographi]MBD1552816.1 CinA family protein [Pseudomonas typographi]MBD1600622.1 CinA family protein [Pseudomonas typographi]